MGALLQMLLEEAAETTVELALLRVEVQRLRDDLAQAAVKKDTVMDLGKLNMRQALLEDAIRLVHGAINAQSLRVKKLEDGRKKIVEELAAVEDRAQHGFLAFLAGMARTLMGDMFGRGRWRYWLQAAGTAMFLWWAVAYARETLHPTPRPPAAKGWIR